MKDEEYLIVVVDGLAPSNRHGVVFLTRVEDETLDAANVFEDLQDRPRRDVLGRFDFWISGGKQNRWFHGWPNDKIFKECFTFKWKYRNVGHRYYGFLCHPLPKTMPRFQLCVLHSHAAKHGKNTDQTYLNLAVQLKKDAQVLSAIKTQYPDW